jgi:hypothetical protein
VKRNSHNLKIGTDINLSSFCEFYFIKLIGKIQFWTVLNLKFVFWTTFLYNILAISHSMFSLRGYLWNICSLRNQIYVTEADVLFSVKNELEENKGCKRRTEWHYGNISLSHLCFVKCPFRISVEMTGYSEFSPIPTGRIGGENGPVLQFSPSHILSKRSFSSLILFHKPQISCSS